MFSQNVISISYKSLGKTLEEIHIKQGKTKKFEIINWMVKSLLPF